MWNLCQISSIQHEGTQECINHESVTVAFVCLDLYNKHNLTGNLEILHLSLPIMKETVWHSLPKTERERCEECELKTTRMKDNSGEKREIKNIFYSRLAVD